MFSSLRFVSRFTGFFLFLYLIVGLWSCQGPDEPTPQATDLPTKWANLTLQLVKNSPANTPTYSSRALGYIGLTMYESVVHGSDVHQSIASRLNGMLQLPQPEADKDYDWELSLNAGQSYILQKMYEHASDELKNQITALEKSVTDAHTDVSQEVRDRSAGYGLAVATAIYEWSKTDGGHQGYTRNFVPEYVWPTDPGHWTPPLVGQSSVPLPLHPYWGTNRTFSEANSLLTVPTMKAYSTNKSSPYYAEMKAVYDKSQKLTNEDYKIALWWSDDPSATAAPPGHSYNLATIAISTAKADLFTAAETYARVGMVTADAFITCWKCKYTYHAERPSSFIQKNIAANWSSWWPEPPFPAFSSGHATQGAATATVLTSIYGDNFKFKDDTHVGRAPIYDNIPFTARSFNSFWEAAEESAHSRFLGAIHTQQDNATGLAEGKKVGENINNLGWRK